MSHFSLGFLFVRAHSQEFRLGLTLPLTGAYSIYGREAKQGIELAGEEANVADGIGGKEITLTIEAFGTGEAGDYFSLISALATFSFNSLSSSFRAGISMTAPGPGARASISTTSTMR